MSTQRIIFLNNTGVDSLCRGRYEEAIKCFRHAILLAKSAVETMEDSPHHTHEGDGMDLVASLPLNNMTDNEECYSNHMFDVYQRGFYLPKMNEHNHVGAEHEIPALTVVLLYNLGLSHHLAVLTGCCENSETTLMEGLRYYQLALMTARSTQPGNHHNHTSVTNFFVLILGCLTNMGHIFCLFWDHRQAKTCRGLLDRMLESSHHNGVPLPTADEDFFFSSSTLTWYNSERMQNPAPAA
eukprot:scaffold8008_cov153-Amphora_coffeaeformis.AAC.6